MTITTADYIELRKKVDSQGLLKYTPFYNLSKILIILVILIFLFWILIYYKTITVAVLMSFPIAFIVIQMGFIGHDAGHGSISRKKSLNDIIGQITLSFFMGVSFNYWRRSHNLHHMEPNHEEIDPDINEGSPLSFIEREAKKRKGLTRLITRYQSFILFPASLFLVFTRQNESLKYIIKNKKGMLIDIFFISLHVLFFIGVLSYYIGVFTALILYLMVFIQIGFYFGFAFIPNHLGLPTIKEGNNLSFLEKQVITSRDIRGGKILSFISGHLNYQIEHHIFPNASRKNLLKIKKIVKAFCIKKRIEYNDDSLLGAWKSVFIYMNKIGKIAIRLNIKKINSEMF